MAKKKASATKSTAPKKTSKKKASATKSTAPRKTSKKKKSAPKKGVVSRRSTNTAVTKKSSKKKSSEPRSLSPAVQAVTDAFSRLSKDERSYYDKVVELQSKMRKTEILVVFDIGQALLECKRKHPNSGADKIIEEAAGITSAHGRMYRMIAERFKRDELEGYANLENSTTKWRMPWTTYYYITLRASTKAERKEIINAVVQEQMSLVTLNERFPLSADDSDSSSESSSQNVTSLGGLIKKALKTAENERTLLQSLQSKELIKELRKRDVATKYANDIVELMDKLRSMREDADNYYSILEEIRENFGDDITPDLDDPDDIDSDEEFEDEGDEDFLGDV